MTTTVVIGAGPTGIAVAAGAISRATNVVLLEAADRAGGRAATYHRRGYTFEPTGAQWLTNQAPSSAIRLLLEQEAGGFHTAWREVAVYLAEEELLIPHPVQHHLVRFGAVRARRFTQDMNAAKDQEELSLKDQIRRNLGAELARLTTGAFFDRQTAGQAHLIAAPLTKRPVPALVSKGARADVDPALRAWSYPNQPGGWGRLWDRLAARLELRANCPAQHITPPSVRQGVHSVDAPRLGFSAHNVVSTLPLPETLHLCGLPPPQLPGISAGAVVVNIGGKAGSKLPTAARVLTPDSQAGFHTVELTSNVFHALAPRARTSMAAVYSIQGTPDTDQLGSWATKELTEWGWLSGVDEVDVVHLPHAYVWPSIGGDWLVDSRRALGRANVTWAGPYAHWQNQTMDVAVAGGLAVGAAIRGGSR